MSNANNMTTEQLQTLTLDELKTIYSATNLIIPSGYHVDNRDHYIGLFSRDLEFGRLLYTWAADGTRTIL
jgi:hypothetical protein